MYNLIFLKNKIFWPLVYILFISLYGFVGAGRGHYIYLILGYAVVKLIFMKGHRQNINNIRRSTGLFKKILIILVAIATILIIVGYLTSARKGFTDLTTENIQVGIKDFFEQVVVYQIGPYRALDYALSDNYIDQIGQLYGRGTLAGVEEIIFTIFSLFGRTDIFRPSNELIAPILQGNQILVGSEQGFNFAYTHLMIFYLDFKLWGIIIIPFLYGLFYRKAVNHYLLSPNIFSLTLILFLALSLLESNFKYGLQIMPQVIVVIASLFLSKMYRAIVQKV